MMTVHEVSELTGLSVRTLRYYDQIGLLPPARYSQAGYRLYDSASLERLQQILLFRELEFPLREIRAILHRPEFDRDTALAQQIRLLTLKKEHLENLIAFACGMQKTGGTAMDFSTFDKTQLEEYAAAAKAAWGDTDAYRAYQEKRKGRSSQQEEALARGLMQIFEAFGRIRQLPADGPEAQSLVRRLQSYLTEQYYSCPPALLAALGRMYVEDEAFTGNIDSAGGAGTAQFAAAAIACYCRNDPAPT